METLTINFLKSGGLITNYYCSSTCRHCLYRCTPHWPKNYCSPSKALQIFKILRKLGCNSIHIDGGEPFLNTETLLEILILAKRCGIKIEYIETNASWFNDSEENHQILEKINSLDLSRLLISISPFHNEFIPFYKVKNLINSCNKHNILISGWIWDFFGDVNKLDDTKAHTLEEYEQLFGQEYILQLSKRYGIKPSGRAIEFLSNIQNGIPLQILLSKHQGGCPEISNVDHFHIDLFGNYIPGTCAGLSIRMEDLGKKHSKRNYPILSRLHEEGINGLLNYVRDVYGFEAKKSLYVSKCELCYEIRAFLINEEKILSYEIRPYEHYLGTVQE